MNGLMLKLENVKTQLQTLRSAVETIQAVQEQHSEQIKSTDEQQEQLSSSHDSLSAQLTSEVEQLREQLASLLLTSVEEEKVEKKEEKDEENDGIRELLIQNKVT